VVEVLPDAEAGGRYFPEKHLASWLRGQQEDCRVFAFEKTGVVPLKRAYEALVEELGVDAVVLVDGGSDSLLRGDETELGTPAEDLSSVAAVQALPVRTKLLASIGFGVDAFHGVSHAQVLENVAALTMQGGYLGAFSLLPQMEEFRLYKRALDTAHDAMPEQPSIVNASIISAVEGDYGNVHRTKRTRGSKLWINPLMAMYFTFDLVAVARRALYLELIKNTQTIFEVTAIIEAFQREHQALRPRETIPV
jgi:hypothetical protein